MTAYTIHAGDIAAHAVALVAATEDVVTFQSEGLTSRGVEVLIHSGTAPVYVSIGGVPATVAGADTLVVLPGSSIEFQQGAASGGAVRLISAAAAVYSVTEVVS